MGGRRARKQGDDYYTGRWLTHDPLGITPNPQRQIRFEPFEQYGDGLCLYTYASDSPVIGFDPDGKRIRIWDCLPVSRAFLCLWRLRYRRFPGMHVTDYMHCMPRELPSRRTEEQIQACETCVSQAELQYYVNLWAPTVGVDLAEGIAVYCLFHVGPPG